MDCSIVSSIIHGCRFFVAPLEKHGGHPSRHHSDNIPADSKTTLDIFHHDGIRNGKDSRNKEAQEQCKADDMLIGGLLDVNAPPDGDLIRAIVDARIQLFRQAR